ncbi:MAG: hypothetical protein IT437_01635 [Phycisphaerales bacterium]|nr:hypothetical protein [Phycisphaerales bacterium]
MQPQNAGVPARRGGEGGGAPGPDRRKSDTGAPSGLERRRGPGRRLSDFVKAAEEGEMNREQFLFLVAIEDFKKANAKMYPSWTDVLEIVRLLGYRKTMPSELRLRNAEDWREPYDAPAAVRTARQIERHERARDEAA